MDLSIRDAQLPAAGYPDLASGLDALGIRLVEIEVDRDMQAMGLRGGKADLSTRAGQSDYLKAFADGGFGIAAFLLHNNFGIEDLDREVDWVTAVVAMAGEMEVPAVRIDAIMKGEREMSLTDRQDHFARCMKKVLDGTPGSSVPCGIENHGFQGNDPDFLTGLIERVDSPRLGLTMDMGNFYWAGHPLSKVYDILRWAAGYTCHTHIKNIHYPEDKRNAQRDMGWEYGQYVSPLDEGDIDLGRVVGFLKGAGYTNTLCIEDESLHRFPEAERKAILRRDADHLRRFLE